MGPLCLGPPAPVITAQSLASPLSWCRAAAAPTPGLGLGGGGSAAAASRCSQVEPSIEVQPHCATCHAPAQTICLPVSIFGNVKPWQMDVGAFIAELVFPLL